MKLYQNDEDRCDFCSAHEVVWRYPCRTFTAFAEHGLTGESVGDWAACATCATLIDFNEHEALVQRSLNTLKKLPIWQFIKAGITPSVIVEFHRLFREHRTGPPVKGTP